MFLNGSDVPQLAGFIVPYIIAVIAVTLRLLARRIANIRFWWDDWLAVCSLVTCTGSVIGYIYCIKLGLGRHSATIDQSAVTSFLKAVFILEIGFAVSILLVKCAILAFYIRVFNVGKVRLQVYVIGALVVAGTGSYIIASFLRCIPLQALWNPTVPGLCFDGFSFDTAQAGASLVTCFWILGLFQYVIWGLHLRKSQRILLSGVFLVGCFVCFVACVRLWALATFDSRSHDPTQAYTAVLTWTSTEPNVALTCACLPSLGPIFARSSKANQDASRHSFEKEPIRANQEAFGRRGNDTESLAELSSGDLAPAVLAYQLPLSRQLLDPPRRINHTPPSYTTVGSNVV